MVEVGNNLDPDEEFDVLHNILDFPMECLEEDEVAEDWDMNNPQCLGPIPSDVLMGISMISDENFNSKSPSLFPRPVAPIPPKRKFAEVQKSGSFCTQSPVSILESSGSYSREKSFPIKSDNAIPVQSRSKRVRYGGINPWLSAARGISTSILTSNARRSKVSRKRVFQLPAAMDLVESSSRNVDSSLDGSDPAHLQNTSKPCLLVKKCAHCQTTKTPLWRWGPLGRKTLCNACGVRFRSGRLFPEYRPAASPTFVPSQHSNSHGKVEEMRNKAERLSVKIKIQIVSAPEQMQLAKQAGTSSSLLPPQIVGAPEQEQLTKHIDTFVGVPEGNQLTKHVDTSSSLKSPQIAGVLKRKQLMKHADTSFSLIPPQIARVPEHKQLAMHVDNSISLFPPQIAGASQRKWLAKYCTYRSHIPSQNEFTNVHESGAVCTENHVSLLDSSDSSLSEKSSSIMSTRLKRIKPAGAITASPSTCRKTSNARAGKECRKKSCHLPVAMDVSKNDESSLDVSDPARPAAVKKCAHCQSTKTPQWREGPLGPRTLCNACGVRHRSGCLLPEYRPAASPTFVPSQHSNFHSKVVQMRINATCSTAESKQGRTYISEATS